jgi:hypothetical protein
MSKQVILAALFALAAVGCASPHTVRPPTRLDASTVQTAEASFKKMASELPGDGWRKLSMAMIAINLKGVQSAHEVVNNPALQSPTIGRIKDEVAGMTAQEIIEYASKVSTVRMEVNGQ